MTMLVELEKAIKELEVQKQKLSRKIQNSGWKDDRNHERIPEKRVPAIILDDLDVVTVPAKSPLPPDAGRIYQQWYSAARTILAKNQPNRLPEFDAAYSPTGKDTGAGIKELLARKHVTKDEQFWLMDLINAQFDILTAVPSHLKFSMYDIELTAYSVLMDDEIGAARHLLSKGFLRAAGALAGVVLERHLKNLLRKHTPPIRYNEKVTLGPLNELCKETVYDFKTWRKIQFLTDLRNLCDHDKKQEPTKNEVTELINGVSALLKTHNISKPD